MPVVWNAGKSFGVALLFFPVFGLVHELVRFLLVELLLGLLDFGTSLSADADLDNLFSFSRIFLLRLTFLSRRCI